MLKPTYFIIVDWNNDGQIDATYDDISADVRAIDATHGKERELAKTQAGTFTLTVRNADHKYSPPNASSLLNQGGRTLNKSVRAEIQAAYPYDTFVDTDVVTLENHIPLNDSNWVWTQQSGAMEIATNKIKCTSGNGISTIAAFGVTNPLDNSMQVNFTKGANDDCILVWRYLNSLNYLYLRTTATKLQVREVIAGVDSLVADIDYIWAAGDSGTVRVQLHGDDIFVFGNRGWTALGGYLILLFKTSSLLNETVSTCGIGGPSIHVDARYANYGFFRHIGFGRLNRIVPVPHPTEKVVYLECNDDFFKLANTDIFLINDKLMTNDMWGHIAYVLNNVQKIIPVTDGFTIFNSIFDTGVSITQSYKAFWDKKALEQLQNFEAEENGFFYQDVMGNWRFEARGHRAAYPHTTSQSIISDIINSASTLIASSDAVSSTDPSEPTSYILLKELTLTANFDRLTIDFDLRHNVAGKTAYGRIYKNDIAIGTERTVVGTTFQTFSETIIASFLIGDKIQIYVKGQSYIGVDKFILVRNFRLYAILASAYYSEMSWMGWDDDVINIAMASAYLSKDDYLFSLLLGTSTVYQQAINPQEVWRCREVDIFDQIIGVADVSIAASSISIPAGSSKEIFFEVDKFDAVTNILQPTMTETEVYIHAKIQNGPFVVGQEILATSGARAILVDVRGERIIGRLEDGPQFIQASDALLTNDSGTFVTGGDIYDVINLADIRANSQANGLGTDKTAFLTAAVDVSAVSGKGGKITLFNSDSGTIWVTKLRLRGDGYTYQPKVYAESHDFNSLDYYGEKRINVDCDLLLTRTELKALTDDIISKSKDKKSKISIVVYGATPANMLAILNLQVSDRITLKSTAMGLNEDFYINKKQFTAPDMTKRLDCLFLLEQVAPTEFQNNLIMLDAGTQSYLDTDNRLG